MHVPARGEAGGHEHRTGVDVLQVTTHGCAPRHGLPRILRTRLALTAAGDLEVDSDVLGVRRLPDADGRTRVALVAPEIRTGHDGRIEVEVAAGRALEIVEVNGTGAHAVRHPRTQWVVDVRLGADAVLLWPTLPIVVATGADVLRLVHVDLAPRARVVLRETLLLDRPGEQGGRIRSTIRARLDDRPLLAETFVVEPGLPLVLPRDATTGVGPDDAPRASLAPHADDRRMDTLLVLGTRLAHPGALQLERAGSVLRGPDARVHDHDLGEALADLAARA